MTDLNLEILVDASKSLKSRITMLLKTSNWGDARDYLWTDEVNYMYSMYQKIYQITQEETRRKLNG
jgi:hypothetical protein